MHTPMIVVGVDGSPPSERALCWAALDDGRRSVELAVVLAYRGRLPERWVVREPEFDEYVRDLALAVGVPGVESEDVNIERRGSNALRITGQYRECTGTMRRQSRRSGPFEYDVILPGGVNPEKVDPTLEDGVLTVRWGKAQARARIEVEGRSEAGQVQAAEGAPGQQATGPETAAA